MIKKIVYSAIYLLISINATAQSVYLATGGKCSFFSSTPVEDISAVSESMTSVLSVASREMQFKVPMKSFKFQKALMQEHFNEKYVESDKFPYATFKGKINEDVDLTKDGVYEVTATGVFNVHGIDKNTTEKGKVTVKGETITIECRFNVAIRDHKIEVPKIVVANIAEIIEVKMNCLYHPYNKEKK